MLARQVFARWPCYRLLAGRAFMGWRERVLEDLLPKAQAAAHEVCGDVLRVDFDWRFAVFNVVLAEGSACDEDDIEAAVRTATKLGSSFDCPPVYRYTLHTRKVAGLVQHPPVQGRMLPLRLQLQELLGLRAGYSELRSTAEPFPRCVTFALGGLPAMGFVAEPSSGAATDLSTEAGQVAHEADLRVSQAKFHVHEGLLWEVTGPTPAAKFKAWIASLPVDESLLIIDTTFSGGGIDRIIKVLLETTDRPREIHVHGLIDLSRTPTPPPPREENDKGGTIKAILHPVPRLITEDVATLLGYDSLRDVGGLKPLWGSSTVEVCDGNDVLTVIGTSNVAHTVSELVQSSVGPGAALDADYHAASTYMAALTQLGNERDRGLAGVDAARQHKLIDSAEWEAERNGIIKRHEALKNGAARRYTDGKRGG